ETETVLARGSPVARALVAAGPRERGQDLVSEPDRIGLGMVPDLDGRCCLDRPDSRPHLGPAVAPRLDPAALVDGHDLRVGCRPSRLLRTVAYRVVLAVTRRD